MFVYGDVVYAQTWQVLTLKNCMEPFSYASAAYVVASALVAVRLFCKNLGNLKKFFGQMVYRPPWQKITRTPMTLVGVLVIFFTDLCEQEINAIESTLKDAIHLQFLAFK